VPPTPRTDPSGSPPGLAAAGPRLHRVWTPEGVPLPFAVAGVGERISAFALDGLLLLLATLAVALLAGFASVVSSNLAAAFFALAVFLIWNAYFIVCEIRGNGRTPGKKKAGLRVVSRDGGPLTAEAVIARNLMRDLEVFLPLAAVLLPESLVPAAPSWGRLVAIAWLLVFALLPLFGKDRLRAGDLVAGTIVVRNPGAVLLPDLAEAPAVRPAARSSPFGSAVEAARSPAEEYGFTREQLDIYGIHELQVLEDLLRRHDGGTLDPRVLEEVCEKIKEKIGWPAERWQVPPAPFLQAFYRAQRASLEKRMLFGQRRERKR
jgi:uncharacterized RDD family membrane protein YckC